MDLLNMLALLPAIQLWQTSALFDPIFKFEFDHGTSEHIHLVQRGWIGPVWTSCLVLLEPAARLVDQSLWSMQKWTLEQCGVLKSSDPLLKVCWNSLRWDNLLTHASQFNFFSFYLKLFHAARRARKMMGIPSVTDASESSSLQSSFTRSMRRKGSSLLSASLALPTKMDSIPSC